ncbi:MAG: LacI family transcriptional regulator [Bacteroidia bacterium]|nr:LacI family transcriptional regulator [Bacteroidia bacterium]
MRKKTSLADIAQSLDVSKTLVSMVLNGHGDSNGISRETQERVLAKAKELNYQPNMLARGLRMGKTNTVGLIVSDISNPFYAKIIRAVEDALSAYSYNLIVCSSDENKKKEIELIQMLEHKQVDGIIISTSQATESELIKLKQPGLPFVLVDRYVRSDNIPFVGTDNYHGAYALANHFLDNGYKKVVILSHKPTHLSTLNDRKKGFLQGLSDRGLSDSEYRIIDVPFTNRHAHVIREMQQLYDLFNPDSVFCLNNSLAIACLDFCKQNNISIPTQLGVASYDEIDLFRLLPTTITSVEQPVQKIGSKAVEILFQHINAQVPIPPVSYQIKPKLNIRESSAKKTH